MTTKPTQLQEFIDSLSESTKIQCRRDLMSQISHQLLDGIAETELDSMMLLGQLAEFVQILDTGMYEEVA